MKFQGKKTKQTKWLCPSPTIFPFDLFPSWSDIFFRVHSKLFSFSMNQCWIPLICLEKMTFLPTPFTSPSLPSLYSMLLYLSYQLFLFFSLFLLSFILFFSFSFFFFSLCSSFYLHPYKMFSSSSLTYLIISLFLFLDFLCVFCNKKEFDWYCHFKCNFELMVTHLLLFSCFFSYLLICQHFTCLVADLLHCLPIFQLPIFPLPISPFFSSVFIRPVRLGSSS